MDQKPIKLNTEKIHELIGVNPDARQYFYAIADNGWLVWFWKNGFLDVIKEKASAFRETLLQAWKGPCCTNHH